MGTKLTRYVGQRENGSFEVRGAVMSIEALMSAVDAAGYVMVAEDDLPEAFGSEQVQPWEASTALTVWQPVLAAAASKPTWSAQASHAWSWIAGRFVNGAPA
ncbi:MAG: hypothetical protein ABL907_00435 [Hyphomicrobium sp.]